MIVAVHIKTVGNIDKIFKGITLPKGWEARSFLDAAKSMTASATGISLEKLDDQGVLNSYLGAEWSYTREERFIKGGNVSREPVRYYLSPKMILTKMYELGREIHSNFWVNSLLQEYTPEKKWLVLIMYPNEFAAVKEFDAYTIFYEAASSRGMLDAIKSQFDQVVKNADAFEVLLQQKLK